MRRFICEHCTFEWDGPVDDATCPFCNSSRIIARGALVKRRCSKCSYVWSEIDGKSGCPACGSSEVVDYIKPRKLSCNACSHRWISRGDYPECPMCGSYDVGFDYDVNTRYDIVLDAVGEMRTQVILTVADLCTIDIESAQAMVERCPVCLIDNLDEMAASPLKIRFEDMGATVSLRPTEKAVSDAESE